MSIYLGFYQAVPEYVAESGARARAQGLSPDPKFRQLVIDLPQKLPSSCKLLGAFATQQVDGLPSVIIVDTNNTDDLFFVNQYYSGYLQFKWAPARSIGTTPQEREAAMNAAQIPVGAR